MADADLTRALAALRDGPVPLGSGTDLGEQRARMLPRVRNLVQEMPGRVRRERRRWRVFQTLAAAATLGLSGFALYFASGPDESALLRPEAGQVRVESLGSEGLYWTDEGASPVALTQVASVPARGVLTADDVSAGHMTTARGVQVQVAERTRLDLGALGKQVGPSALRLFRGAVECHVPKLDENERFSVVTKDAEVVVHGTVFSVRVGDANEPSTCVRVEEGVVAVHHAHGVARITGGQSWGCDKVKVASTDRQPTPVVGLPVVMAEKSERTQEAAPASARHTRARAAQRPAVVERPEKTTPRGSAEETVVAVSEPREPVTSEDAAPVLSGTLAAENRLLTEALSAEQAGDASQARSLFSQLLARYPSSPLGPEARAGLARLR